MEVQGRLLTIVGASARAAAYSALRAGFSSSSADLFADADLRQLGPTTRVLRYPADLAEAIQPGIPWLYTGALENHPGLIARMAERAPLLGCGPEVLLHLRSPWRLRELLADHGCKAPRLAQRAAELDSPLNSTLRWVRKRERSAGGTHLAMWTGKENIAESAGHYFQEYIAGRPCAAIFVVETAGAHCAGMSEQLLAGAGAKFPFAYRGSIGPMLLEARHVEQLMCIGRALLASGARGFIGVDVVDDGEQLWPIEVNPRYTASVEVLERGLETALLGWHVAACEGTPFTVPSLSPAPKVCAGKWIVYAEKPTMINAGITRELLAWNDNQPWPVAADIPNAESSIAAGHPLLTVLAADLDSEAVRKKLAELERRVRAMLHNGEKTRLASPHPGPLPKGEAED